MNTPIPTPTLTRRSLRAAALLTATGIAAACGSSSADLGASEPDATLGTVATAARVSDDPTTTLDTPSANGIDSVQPAVIQIEALGTIRSPEVGLTDGSGRGSGFIISPDGLAVTNNHVVTGAATLEVFIGGDTSRSYNARVIGVSECNDLALIDIDEPDPLPTLSWFTDDITTGLEVYAAGFPLGETEYTLTRGIVSKVNAKGETNWASLDSVLEHDANIQPGNSGGPLVTADGRVVGVNYRGRDVTGTTQFYAIDEIRAQEVVDELRNGDFESIGVNGEAVVDEEAGIAGVWVSGVDPGSPASETGILPGDIIQSMNGLPIGTDGTLSSYCDVLRTSGDDPIRVEVLRFDTSEILSGELNGTKPLAVSFSFAEVVEEEAPAEAVEPAAAYSEYKTITDESSTLTVDVPMEWVDVTGGATTLDDGSVIPVLNASTNVEQFTNSYDVPGLLMTAFGPVDDFDAALAQLAPAPGECVDGGIQDYSDARHTGRFQVWTDCGGTGAVLVVLVAVPVGGGGYTAVMAFQVTSDADLAALDQAFNSFSVAL